MDRETEEKAVELAANHVDWFIGTIRPLLIHHMIHGFKHGIEYKNSPEINQKIKTDFSIFPHNNTGLCSHGTSWLMPCEQCGR